MWATGPPASFKYRKGKYLMADTIFSEQQCRLLSCSHSWRHVWINSKRTVLLFGPSVPGEPRFYLQCANHDTLIGAVGGTPAVSGQPPCEMCTLGVSRQRFPECVSASRPRAGARINYHEQTWMRISMRRGGLLQPAVDIVPSAIRQVQEGILKVQIKLEGHLFSEPASVPEQLLDRTESKQVSREMDER